MSNAAPRLEVSSWDGKTLRLDFFITLTEGRKRESGRCMLCLLAWMKIFYHRVDVRGRKRRKGIQGQNNTLPEDDCLQGRRPGFHPWVGKIPWKKKIATHSSILAWKIPWTEEPGRLQSMGSQRVRHD